MSNPLYAAASRAAWVGLLVNLALAAVKLVAGVFGHSIAMVADAANSIGDAFTSGVIIYALRYAQRPPDREHPYGHTRAEAVAGTNVAVLIAVSALFIAVEAVRHLADSHTVLPPVWTLWIAGANVVIKEAMYRYKRHVGKRTNSMVMLAGAWDHRLDAFCSAAVLVGLAMVRYGGEGMVWADEVAALVVVGAILIAAWKLFRRGASQLLDEQYDDEMVLAMRQTAEQVEGVQRVEKLRARRSGIEVFVDIHIEVEPTLTVAEGHTLAHEVQRRLIGDYKPVRDVLVHVEPTTVGGVHTREV